MQGRCRRPLVVAVNRLHVGDVTASTKTSLYHKLTESRSQAQCIALLCQQQNAHSVWCVVSGRHYDNDSSNKCLKRAKLNWFSIEPMAGMSATVVDADRRAEKE